MPHIQHNKDQAITRLAVGDLGIDDVADIFGVHRATVRRWARDAGRDDLAGRTREKIRKQALREAAIANAMAGISMKESAIMLGVNHNAVRYVMRNSGIKSTIQLGGAQQYWDRKRVTALHRLALGVPVKTIATDLGVSTSLVSKWGKDSAMNVLQRGRRGGSHRFDHQITDPGSATKVGKGLRLTLTDRVAIAEGLKQGKSAAAIAVTVGRNRSVISREIARGCVDGVYIAGQAHTKACQRLSRPKVSKLEDSPMLRASVIRLLNKRCSPQQIAGRLRLRHGNDESMQISHETIYQALYVQGYGALREELKVEKALRRGGTRRTPRSKLPARNGRPWLFGARITDRPAQAADRAIPGHWEGDLVIGTDLKTALITLVERHSRYILLRRLGTNHEAQTVAQALTEMITALPADLVRTLTWDQGKEMAQVPAFEIATDVDVFFCDPHSPWQRPTNENSNGLVREFFPKSTNFSQVTDHQVQEAEDLLNERPREVLGFHTPSEILIQSLNGALTA